MMANGFVYAVLIGATLLIALLCWVWMKNSRASQQRMEAAQQQMIDLLREQNELLRRSAGGPGGK